MSTMSTCPPCARPVSDIIPITNIEHLNGVSLVHFRDGSIDPNFIRSHRQPTVIIQGKTFIGTFDRSAQSGNPILVIPNTRIASSALDAQFPALAAHMSFSVPYTTKIDPTSTIAYKTTTTPKPSSTPVPYTPYTPYTNTPTVPQTYTQIMQSLQTNSGNSCPMLKTYTVVLCIVACILIGLFIGWLTSIWPSSSRNSTVATF